MRGRMTGMAALAAAGLLIAGCGGGGDDKALTKEEFLKQGNAICTKGNDKINAAGKAQFGNQPPSKADIEKFAKETVVPTVEDELKQLHALKPPKADEATVNDILDAADKGLEKAKADPASLAKDNSDPTNPFAEANKKANAYGLTACGS